VNTGERKERRGFASMSPEKQREIASKGGRAAHEKGTAHEWTADEARSAGRKGGQVSRGGRGRLVVVTSLAIDAESTGGETGETTTVGAAVADGTSEMNHDSWSAPLAALSASLLTLGSPERMSQESGRGVGGMFTPAFVEADVDPTFTPRSDGVKVI